MPFTTVDKILGTPLSHSHTRELDARYLLLTGDTMTGGITNSTSLNPLTTLAESWIGPSSTTGIYFKGGNVGVGTTSPLAKLQVGIASASTASIGDIIIARSDGVGSHYKFKMGLDSGFNFSLGGYGSGETTTYAPYVTVKYADGNVGIGTTSPTNLLSLGGQSDRIFWMERMTTAATAGKALSILAGGCVVGGTNLASGILKIGGQLATGSGNSEVQIIGTNGTNNGATTDTTPAVMIDVINNKIGLYGVTPVVRPTALTAQLTTITATAPVTPDYAIADLTTTLPYGFVSADEGQSVLKVILNLQTRVSELETKLQALGILT